MFTELIYAPPSLTLEIGQRGPGRQSHVTFYDTANEPLAEAIAKLQACDPETNTRVAAAAQFERKEATLIIWSGDKYVEKEYPKTACVVLAVVQEKLNHRLRLLLWHSERKDAAEPEFSMPHLDNVGPVQQQTERGRERERGAMKTHQV